MDMLMYLKPTVCINFSYNENDHEVRSHLLVEETAAADKLIGKIT